MGCGHWECSHGYSCGCARFDTIVSHFNGVESWKNLIEQLYTAIAGVNGRWGQVVNETACCHSEATALLRLHGSRWTLQKRACEEQEVEMDIGGIKIISWRLRGRHTQRPALKPFISACVSLQQQRLFNLDASEKLVWETDSSFHFHRSHCVLNLDEFGSRMTRSFKRNMPEEQEVEMDIWNTVKIISWRLRGRDTQRPAAMPFISARVSLQQQWFGHLGDQTEVG